MSRWTWFGDGERKSGRSALQPDLNRQFSSDGRFVRRTRLNLRNRHSITKRMIEIFWMAYWYPSSITETKQASFPIIQDAKTTIIGRRVRIPPSKRKQIANLIRPQRIWKVNQKHWYLDDTYGCQTTHQSIPSIIWRSRWERRQGPNCRGCHLTLDFLLYILTTSKLEGMVQALSDSSWVLYHLTEDANFVIRWEDVSLECLANWSPFPGSSTRRSRFPVFFAVSQA